MRTPAILLSAALAGCGLLPEVTVTWSRREPPPEAAAAAAPTAEERLKALEAAPADPALVERGRAVYRAACAACHGASGDGQGPAFFPLEPKPRDFTRAEFKWRSTESGALPLDRDLFRTVTRGVPGTWMPAFEPLLSVRDRWAAVQYLKTFSRRFAEEGVAPEEVVPAPAAPPSTPAQVARGRAVYERLQCARCHGPAGRGDGPSARELKDSLDRPIRPFDFTTGRYRGGGTPADLYRTFMTGIDGTPMPSFKGQVEDKDRWPLVHYVLSLSRERGALEWLVEGERARAGESR